MNKEQLKTCHISLQKYEDAACKMLEILLQLCNKRENAANIKIDQCVKRRPS